MIEKAKTLGAMLSLTKSSLKHRFYAITLVWLVLLSALAAFAIPSIVDLYLRQNSIQQLDLVYEDLLANLEWDAEGTLHLAGNISDPRYQQPHSGFYWRASTQDQLLRSRSLWDTDFTFTDNQQSESLATQNPLDYLFREDEPILGARGEKLIVLVKSMRLVGDRTPVTVIVGIDEDPLEKMVRNISSSIGIIFAAVVVGLCALLFVQLHWTFRPLKRLQNSVNDLEKGRVESVVGHYPLELMPLVNDLNAILFHYHELLERSRHHAGNLSHALKTPLTVLKQDAMRLSESDRAPILHGIAQLQSQIDYHLAQARLAGAKNILAVESNPSRVVDNLTLAFDKVYQQREVLLVNELSDDWRVAVEEQDLNEILGNVIENGYKWASHQVIVSGKQTKQSITINIEDDGPGVDEKQLHELAIRGRRLDEHTIGSGLGLSIANAAVQSYSGIIEFSGGRLGGLCVEITLPRK